MVPIVISDLRGGRNGIDSPIDPAVPDDQCVEAMNVDWSNGALGRRRGGCSSLSLTGGTAFTTQINAMSRFVPSGDETLAELFATDGAAVPLTKRLAGGTAWANVTFDDPITTRPQDVHWATLNGKHFCCYNAGAGVDRLHVYDPGLAVPRVRRVGINQGLVAPTVTNTGAGAYAAIARFYRIRFIQVTGASVTRRSEPTIASLSFTPSGAGLAARIARPALPGEGETHWETDASVDGVNWNKLTKFSDGTHVPIATTFFDDSSATGGYRLLEVSDEIGFYALPPSAAFVVSDGNRLVMAGHLANSLNTSRVWFTPVLGSSDQGDDERLVINARLKTLVDLNEKDGGKVTGMSDPVSGIVFVFKYRRVWRLSPTQDSDKPYQPREVSHVVGTIDGDTVIVAEDAEGKPAVYFLSAKGPYRVGHGGLQFMGRDIEDQWRGLGDKEKINLSATTKVGHGKYYSELGQIWWWVATGSSNTPNLKLVLDIKQATRVDEFGVRGGWSIHDGASAAAICSTVFSDVVGASMSQDLKPYAGLAGPAIYQCDTTDPNDAGTGFQASVTTRSIVPADQIGSLFTVAETVLTALAQAGTTIKQTIIADFGKHEKEAFTSIAPKGTEEFVMPKFGASMDSDLGVVQLRLGDPGVVSVPSWSLESITIPVTKDGPR